MTLPYDVARCSGRYSLMADGGTCPSRDRCQRYLAFVEWDADAGVPDYQRIPVVMGSPDCGMQIKLPRPYEYDGSYVENHCPECGEFESECICSDEVPA